MDTDVFPIDQGQPQASSLAGADDEQLREALREIHQQLAALVDSAMNRAVKAESDASKVRNENYRLCALLAAKDREIRELTTKNGELQARLDAVHTPTEDTHQMNHKLAESEALSMDQDPQEPSPSLTAGDADAAATDSGPSAQGEPQLEHDDCPASNASVSLGGLSDAPAMENDSNEEEPPRHAPKPRKKQRGRFACTECGRRFYKRSVLNQHQRTHSGLKPYQCGQCDKEFNQYVSLRTHEQMHTGDKPYNCGQCDKAFTDSSSLRTHMRLHAGDKPFKCAQCDKAFVRADKLRMHQRTHTGEKPFECLQCGKAYTQSNILRTHQRIHTGEKPYECGHCGKRFSDSSTKRKHERTHTVDKSYQCTQCGKAFTYSNTLRMHQRTHTGVKPYKCAQCGKAFADSSQLRNHEPTHTGVRPYKCGQCDMAFKRSEHLRRHEHTHSGHRPYQCRQCGAAFKRSHHLHIHQRRQHAVAAPSSEANNSVAIALSQLEA